jgi:hypothetical protein
VEVFITGRVIGATNAAVVLPITADRWQNIVHSSNNM